VWYYETIGKYDEALKYAKRQNELQRSFYKLQVPREVAEMKEKYETEKKEREIQALRQAALIRNVVILAATLLLLVIVLLFNRRQLKLKSSYQRKINEQQEALFKTAVHVQDQERKRFAEDLHDGPGSVLSAVKLNLGRLRSQSPDLDESQKEKLGEAQDLLDEAIRELRNIAHNMMPPSLSRFGLKDALENLLAGIEKNSGISISFNYFSEEERLPENVEISVYRIMLEVMNNIVKHSRASEAVVQLVQHREYLSLTAEDNGTGFEKNERNVNGMGLSNIRSRVEYLGGRLEIDSFPGKGTTISIEIPLEKKS
jgi:signal transduction histidine kinase